MKKTLLISLSVIYASIAFSQDTIFYYDTQIRVVKVTEITLSEVKYKQFNSENNSVYSEKKSSIKTIKYKNGDVDNFVRQNNIIQKKDSLRSSTYGDFVLSSDNRYKYMDTYVSNGMMLNIMIKKHDPEFSPFAKRAKRAKLLRYSWVLAFPAAGYSFLYLFINKGATRNDEKVYTGALTAVSGAIAVYCIAGGIIYPIRYKKNKAKAIKAYNEKY